MSNDLLGLLGDAVADELRVVGLQAELAGDEDEPVRDDRLRVRRALERRRSALGPDDGLLRHALLLSRRRRAGERYSERLEDRLEHVLRVLAVQQPHVQRQPRTLGELAQEP